MDLMIHHSALIRQQYYYNWRISTKNYGQELKCLKQQEALNIATKKEVEDMISGSMFCDQKYPL